MAVPEGGAPAGPEVGSRDEGRGKRWGDSDLQQAKRKRRESKSRKDSGKEGWRRDSYWEAYTERAERRYRERSVKRKVKDAESPDDKWTFPLERKAKVPTIQKASEESEEESEDSGPEKPELPKQARLPLPRPRICFSFAPRLSRRWSQWSATDTRPRDSVINELAKMGDPDLLEMVEQEGRTPLERHRERAGCPRGPLHSQHKDPGDVGGPATGMPGTFAEWPALRETDSSMDIGCLSWVGGFPCPAISCATLVAPQDSTEPLSNSGLLECAEPPNKAQLERRDFPQGSHSLECKMGCPLL